MSSELHRRVHTVSHFQVSLLDADAKTAYPDITPGGQFAAFGRRGVVVATAWNDNGNSEPLVEIAVAGFDAPVAGATTLIPIASGEIEIGAAGVLVGNVITSDMKLIRDVAPGRYAVLVSADALVPMTARRVHFHLWPAANGG